MGAGTGRIHCGVTAALRLAKTPRERDPARSPALAAGGRQSLHVLCIGLFLSHGAAELFRLEDFVVLGGFALLGPASASEWTLGLTLPLEDSRG